VLDFFKEAHDAARHRRSYCIIKGLEPRGPGCPRSIDPSGLQRTASDWAPLHAERGAGNSLQTTALINEVYLRLVDLTNVAWQERAQFFAICAQMMRRILVDAARARGAQKRGAGAERVNAEDVELASPEPQDFVIALDAALEEFAKVAPRQAKVIELRYFGGLEEKEIAEVLRVSTRTVELDWNFARSWLMHELRS